MKRNFVAALTVALLATAAPFPAPLPSGLQTAQAQSAVVLENLSFKGAAGAVRIPRITVEGTNASKADIEALFDASSLSQLGPRLARISARSVSIPLIEFTQELPDTTSVTSYRDTVMRDIRNGVIGESVTPVLSAKVSPKTGRKEIPEVDFSMADMVLKGMDLPLMLRFVFDKAQPGEQLKTAAADQTIGKISVRMGSQGAFTIDSVAIKDFKVRPLAKPLMELSADLQKASQDKTKEGEKASMLAALGLMTSMSYGNFEMNGLAGEGTSPTEKAPVKFALKKITGAGGGDVPGRFSMQGLSVQASGGKVDFGEFTVDGVDMSGMWSALQTAAAKPDFKPDELDPTAFLPKINLIRLAGIDINMPDPKAAGQMIKAKLGRFETRMGNHVGPIPADVAVNLDRFQMDIPANTREEGLKNILALGYKAIDVSMAYNQVWDKAKKTLSLKDLSATSAGMLNARMSGEIANVSADVFTLDKAKAAVAALGIVAKSLNVTVVNEGLVQKLIAQQAAQQKRKPEDVRAELAAGAALMVPMMMGDHPGARALGAALGKFAADPKNVKVVMTAKGDGVGSMDFLASGNPMEVLKKVDITATANE
jgi:hypothetical protein